MKIIYLENKKIPKREWQGLIDGMEDEKTWENKHEIKNGRKRVSQ
jgi:hypothetical protein